MYDYPAQHIIGWEFFGQHPPITQEVLDKADDYERLHEWLKKIFKMLYSCDMLARECGLDFGDESWYLSWQQQAEYTLETWFHMKFEKSA
jgi:hypothetical protein